MFHDAAKKKFHFQKLEKLLQDDFFCYLTSISYTHKKILLHLNAKKQMKKSCDLLHCCIIFAAWKNKVLMVFLAINNHSESTQGWCNKPSHHWFIR